LRRIKLFNHYLTITIHREGAKATKKIFFKLRALGGLAVRFLFSGLSGVGSAK